MAFKVFVFVLLVFALGNLLFYIFAPLKYHFSLRTLRKTLYTLFIGTIAVGILRDEVKISNWQFLLTLTTVIVFMDLAILLTPSILKLWKAEFQYSDYVENMIKKNDRISRGTTKRVGIMSDMIQNAGTHFASLPIVTTEQETKKQVEEYLGIYATKFGFGIQLWDVTIEPYDVNRIPVTERNNMDQQQLDAYVDNLALLEAIEKVLTDIELLNSLAFGEKLESYVQSLFRLEIISLLEENLMITPVFIESNNRNMVVVLKATKGELLEVDAVHMTNLIYLYYSFR